MQLIKYDAACKALSEAKSVDEVKNWRDKAAALVAYARQANNKQLEIDAAEIRIRAERRLGGMLKEEGLTHGGDHRSESRFTLGTLKNIGVSKKLSSRAQALARIPDDKPADYPFIRALKPSYTRTPLPTVCGFLMRDYFARLEDA